MSERRQSSSSSFWNSGNQLISLNSLSEFGSQECEIQYLLSELCKVQNIEIVALHKIAFSKLTEGKSTRQNSIRCIIKPTRCTFSNFILITSSTCFEQADEYLAYSKHVENVIRIKFKKVHLGFIIQLITMYGQYNIKSTSFITENWLHTFTFTQIILIIA